MDFISKKSDNPFANLSQDRINLSEKIKSLGQPQYSQTDN